MDFKQSIGYLIHELAQHINAESDQVIYERFGIGYAQYKVLLSVEAKAGVPQKQIALDLSQTEASISRQIGILIDKNLVVIGPAKDNRRHLIYLTPRGEEMVYKVTNSLNQFHSPLFENLSEKEQVKLIELLQTIKNNLRA